MDVPLVSIILPIYNTEQYIQEALASILNNQPIPIEIIVVDDGSTDSSVEKVQLIRDPRVCIVENRGKGIASAINTGLEYVRGLFVSRCDADDKYPLHRLSWQITWLQNHPEFSAVCGTYTAIDSNGNTVVEFQCGDTETEITSELQNGITRTHFGTFLVRTALLRKIGGCRPYFTTAEDIDVQLRLSEHGRIWYVPKVSYLYRLHATSITHTQGSSERDFYNQIARSFQIQRQTEGQDNLERSEPPPIPPSLEGNSRPTTSSEHIYGLLVYRAWNEHQNGQWLTAIATGLKAICYAPVHIPAWINLLLLIVKVPFRDHER